MNRQVRERKRDAIAYLNVIHCAFRALKKLDQSGDFDAQS